MLVYPIIDRKLNLFERLALYLGRIKGYCNICGRYKTFIVNDVNLRENVECTQCGSFNRQRQIVFILCKYLSSITSRKIYNISELDFIHSIRIYNTEASGALHENLKNQNSYYCSEYFGTELKCGSKVNGIHHEDLMNLSLSDECVDIVISSDVFEHIPDPYKAHQEVYRILKKNGRHIFTVPFDSGHFLDDKRAILNNKGEVEYLKDAIYHSDPLRPEGTLVYNIFALEMLCNLKQIGFVTNFYNLYKPWFGIIGNNSIVFEAIRI